MTMSLSVRWEYKSPQCRAGTSSPLAHIIHNKMYDFFSDPEWYDPGLAATWPQDLDDFLAAWAAVPVRPQAQAASAQPPPAPLPPALPALAPQQQQQHHHQQALPPPQQVSGPPVAQGVPAAQPRWAWLAQHVPNATGTYYSYKAQPGVITSS
jgi:hypothetical protein